MSAFYELVGRTVVGFIRRRYGQQLRTAAAIGAGVAALAALAYVAGRDDDDDAA